MTQKDRIYAVIISMPGIDTNRLAEIVGIKPQSCRTTCNVLMRERKVQNIHCNVNGKRTARYYKAGQVPMLVLDTGGAQVEYKPTPGGRIMRLTDTRHNERIERRVTAAVGCSVLATNF